MIIPRGDNVQYVSPEKEVNAGLWTLFFGATVFLGLRLYCKYTRRTRLWYDDYMLILSWVSSSNKADILEKYRLYDNDDSRSLDDAYDNGHHNNKPICDGLCQRLLG